MASDAALAWEQRLANIARQLLDSGVQLYYLCS